MRNSPRSRILNSNRLLFAVLFLAGIGLHLWFANALTAILFYSLLTLPLLSIALTVYYFYRFKYYQTLSATTVVKYESFEYTLQVDNPDPLFYQPLQLDYHSYTLLETESVLPAYLSVPPLSHQLIKAGCRFRCRGEFQIGINTLTMSDYLGLIKLSFRRRDNLSLTVYPRKILLNRFPLPRQSAEKGRSSVSNSPVDDHEIRSFDLYRPGDPFKGIHWKKTAQKGEFIVRRNDSPQNRIVTFVLDLCRYGKGDEESLMEEDRLLECCLAVGMFLLKNDFHLRLLLPENKDTIDYSGPGSADRFFDDLALLPFKTEYRDWLHMLPYQAIGPRYVFTCSEAAAEETPAVLNNEGERSTYLFFPVPPDSGKHTVEYRQSRYLLPLQPDKPLKPFLEGLRL